MLFNYIIFVSKPGGYCYYNNTHFHKSEFKDDNKLNEWNCYEDGMMRIIDTGGDSELGGKDLDLAIVNNLIIPHLEKNYNLKSFKKEKLELLSNLSEWTYNKTSEIINQNK
jgi:hypothetical protein